MKPSPIQKGKGYLIIGSIGLVFSAGYLGLSFQYPLGQLDQPGPGVFPGIVAVIMILASLTTVWAGWKMDRAVHVDFPDGKDRKRLVCMIGLLLGYILLLPWLGQIIVSMLFGVLFLRLLSDLGWLRILVYSFLISIAIYVVFVVLLSVPMPRGALVF
jgi:putative tricarboxylic transport membrane protein